MPPWLTRHGCVRGCVGRILKESEPQIWHPILTPPFPVNLAMNNPPGKWIPMEKMFPNSDVHCQVPWLYEYSATFGQTTLIVRVKFEWKKKPALQCLFILYVVQKFWASGRSKRIWWTTIVFTVSCQVSATVSVRAWQTQKESDQQWMDTFFYLWQYGKWMKMVHV